MLLRALTDNLGSAEVEKAYLGPYRRWLEDLVAAPAEAPVETSALSSDRLEARP
jgi:hypothetical protein